jgi:Methionine biosynthesis protein MetW
MKEYLSVAYNMKHGELTPNEETLNKLIALVGNRRKVLCVGGTTLPLATALVENMACSVTIVADSNDFIGGNIPGTINLVVDSLVSSDLTKRFRNDEFEIVILADALHQIKEYSQVLTKLLTYFSNAIVISVPQLFDNKQALINAQSQEIERLKQIIRIREESLSWYAKRLREHLVNHYKLEKTASERIAHEQQTASKMHQLSEAARLKDEQYSLLEQDRNRIVNELDRISRFSPDKLPSVFRYPLKALILMITCGPKELVQILKKKRA